MIAVGASEVPSRACVSVHNEERNGNYLRAFGGIDRRKLAACPQRVNPQSLNRQFGIPNVVISDMYHFWQVCRTSWTWGPSKSTRAIAEDEPCPGNGELAFSVQRELLAAYLPAVA